MVIKKNPMMITIILRNIPMIICFFVNSSGKRIDKSQESKIKHPSNEHNIMTKSIIKE